MNPALSPTARTGRLFLIGLLLTAGGFAQTASPVPVTNERTVQDHARVLIDEGRIDDAEKTLVLLNRAKESTVDWKFETAQRFAQMSARFAAIGQVEQVRATAERALVHLRAAERLAATPELKSNARSLAGFLCERYLGDIESAKAHYRAATELRPTDKSLKARLNRLEQADATARAREGKG